MESFRPGGRVIQGEAVVIIVKTLSWKQSGPPFNAYPGVILITYAVKTFGFYSNCNRKAELCC